MLKNAIVNAYTRLSHWLRKRKKIPYELQRPFYVIAHRCNNVEDIRKVISKGANAIECDVRSNDGGETWFVNHDRCTEIATDKLDEWLHEAALAAGEFQDRFALLYFDVKSPAYIENLHLFVNRHFRQQHAAPVNVLYSISRVEHAKSFAAIAGKLHPWEGIAIDYEDEPEKVQAFFAETGIDRCWYGNGINAAFPDTKKMRQSLKKAGKLRNSHKIIKKTYIWTLEKPETVANYILRQQVDGLITNAGGGDIPRDSLSEVLSVVNASRTIRIAGRADNPFAVFERKTQQRNI